MATHIRKPDAMVDGTGAFRTLCGRTTESVLTDDAAYLATCKTCLKISGKTDVAVPVTPATDAPYTLATPGTRSKVWREADIVAELSGVRHGLVTVKLRDGDRAVIPGTTKRHFVGTGGGGTVTYLVHSDGMVQWESRSGKSVATVYAGLPVAPALTVQACRDGGPWLDMPDVPAGDEDFTIHYALGCAMLVPSSQWRVLNPRTGETVWLGPNPVTSAELHAETSAPVVATGVPAGAGSARSVDMDGPVRFRSGPCGKRKRFVRRGRRH